MHILAIDTALEACSVVLMNGDAVVAREHQAMARGHAEALMPMIERLRETASLDFATLDRIAVTVGPGSFTGLRVGIAAARGIGLAAGNPVVGVTTLGAYAAPLIAADTSTPVVAAIDARHHHVYLQAFDGDGTTRIKPAYLSIADAARRIAPFIPRLVGNAAQLLAAAWPDDEPSPVAVEQQAAPSIDWVARLGTVVDPASAPPKPFYLKAPDAQPQATTAQVPIQAARP
ncbi:tRNA (adenosine(37)-N6)-threonylcarbamoyltransferase complex dimerization subunit type 1 TsaB [Undibacter mobilis]|uniref:tRNA (Adenosine(37)-N6)-threonylcarbamoyltransferase complex dimerization subunit type 1 TsaB n=1 Tax=Undibacter mobilis TaxID=2292256 RepID=A0A371B8V2_9BRAD|nr:tRNA (adenosine(37)-N6)-threonylcarbamoyltransferase complex dimerization subunit type 1 TsaB [Undibacter mobilis]RDV03937.1 tRNA (adenosine(37)-N6)-threonylcarbamoyltransferase complex dimerization subunit type 1 TsaB [Undibacter mobilis]